MFVPSILPRITVALAVGGGNIIDCFLASCRICPVSGPAIGGFALRSDRCHGGESPTGHRGRDALGDTGAAVVIIPEDSVAGRTLPRKKYYLTRCH